MDFLVGTMQHCGSDNWSTEFHVKFNQRYESMMHIGLEWAFWQTSQNSGLVCYKVWYAPITLMQRVMLKLCRGKNKCEMSFDIWTQVYTKNICLFWI